MTIMQPGRMPHGLQSALKCERDMFVLKDLSQNILSEKNNSPENMTHLILEKSVDLSLCDAGFIFLREGLFLHSAKKESRRFVLKSQLMSGQKIAFKTEYLQEIEDISPQTSFVYDHDHYAIKSLAVIPIRKQGRKIYGFLVLVNKKTAKHIALKNHADIEQYVTDFSDYDKNLLDVLANQASMSFSQTVLVRDLKGAFESFTAASVTAIEARDPTTKGHSERVATLTVALAEAVNKTNQGPHASLHFSKQHLEEIRYAALLHDFGKIGVREDILKKEKKFFAADLERIEKRFQTMKDNIYIQTLENYLEKLMSKQESPSWDMLESCKKQAAAAAQELDEIWQIVLEYNEPRVIREECLGKLQSLCSKEIRVGDRVMPVLTAKEIATLSIARGSLTPAERLEIESHVTHSFKFLKQIPWSVGLKNIPEIVHGHHERLDGSGYPRRLLGDEIPVQAKLMAITDVYDALVAKDRPYKRAISSEQALSILEDEVKQGKLDRDFFQIFANSRVWELVKRTAQSAKADRAA